MTDPTALGNLRQELRRGSVVLVCLLALRQPDYGYSLLRTLARAGVETDANTMYPLLRRLETQGLLVSEWVTEEPRPRRFYRTTTLGEDVAARLLEDWASISQTLNRIQGL